MRKRVALYVRVSTHDQTTKNQARELLAVAKRNGWEIVRKFEDTGISGAKGRDKRPGLDALLEGIARCDFDMVATWSVDRLGRSLTDLVALLSEMQAKGIDLYLHQQGLDTSTPAGKAMYQMMGVFAEFELAIIRERIRSGLARAKAEGKIFGRPRISNEREAAIKKALAAGHGIRRVARDVGVGVSVVQRLKRESPIRRSRRRRAA